MSETKSGGGGAAIISSVLEATGSIFDFLSTNKESKYGRLPDWLSPKDFQQKSYTVEIIIAGIVLAVLTVLIVMAMKISKK